jgi:hypothetical protein
LLEVSASIDPNAKVEVEAEAVWPEHMVALAPIAKPRVLE